ncbi:MAG: ribosome silencing factor [Desulfovibrionaceae bacterium]|nr:ribosome silencing factor [Desulfovibrionaceae bacterium]
MDKVSVIADWLREHKAADVDVIDLEGRGAFTEAMVVATASSVRHAQSLADGVNRLCGENGYEFLRMDGYAVGQWILVDCNDFVVNIFQADTRRLYKLESLWSVPSSKEELQAMAESAGE